MALVRLNKAVRIDVGCGRLGIWGKPEGALSRFIKGGCCLNAKVKQANCLVSRGNIINKKTYAVLVLIILVCFVAIHVVAVVIGAGKV